MELLDVRFYGTWHGKKFYRVLSESHPVFTGTLGECRRFMAFHAEKQEKEDRRQLSPRRRKPHERRFRVATRRARAF